MSGGFGHHVGAHSRRPGAARVLRKALRAVFPLTSIHDPTKVSTLPARIRVLVVDGPDRGAIHETTGAETAIGTSADNEVVLTDPAVSRYHIELHCEEGIVVKDLGSRNGTFVNGVRIRKAVVPPGACVHLGDSVLRLMDGGREIPASRPPAPEIPGVVAVSAAMQDICRAVGQLALLNVSVLLQGETGTGKEIVARAIHSSGPRAGGPFVVVDCGALAPTLIASQLFGHERGAFTGADQRREGAFETANGGSIFLDEIGELPLLVQPTLLGVLERRTFRRLGGKQDIPVDARVIAATHRDLRAEANQGTFRADLYFRLAATRIQIPALRERPDDIEALVEAFCKEVTGKPVPPFSHATMEALRSHRWSGNVRELRNVVESAVAMGNLSLEPGRIQEVIRDNGIAPYRRARAEVVAAFEREYLGRVIHLTEGNVAAAARAAGMARQYLVSLLKKHDLGK
jgi:DNA-binding NtrC family response regulator